MKTLLAFLCLSFAVGLSSCGGSSRESSGARNSDASNVAATAQPTAAATPEETLPKIVAFGDSLTAGYGLAPKESYPALLQKMLDADGFKYEVVNAGVSGDTSAGGVSAAPRSTATVSLRPSAPTRVSRASLPAEA